MISGISPRRSPAAGACWTSTPIPKRSSRLSRTTPNWRRWWPRRRASESPHRRRGRTGGTGGAQSAGVGQGGPYPYAPPGAGPRRTHCRPGRRADARFPVGRTAGRHRRRPGGAAPGTSPNTAGPGGGSRRWQHRPGRGLRLGPGPARVAGTSGVGPWTAELIAMRGLGDPDAFPATDLGCGWPRAGWVYRSSRGP